MLAVSKRQIAVKRWKMRAHSAGANVAKSHPNPEVKCDMGDNFFMYESIVLTGQKRSSARPTPSEAWLWLCYLIDEKSILIS